MPPDAVSLVVEYLRAQDHLAGVTVATDRPTDLVDQVPVLLVEVVEELPRSRMPWARTRRFRLGIQAWAAPEADEALRLMHGALAALYAVRGVLVTDGARIDRVEAAGEPVEVPDLKVGDDVHRMVATVDVTVR